MKKNNLDSFESIFSRIKARVEEKPIDLNVFDYLTKIKPELNINLIDTGTYVEDCNGKRIYYK